MLEGSPARLAWLVAALALVVRLPLMAVGGSVGWAGDTAEYMENADWILSGEFHGTYRVPGYGAIIALLDVLPGSRELWIVAFQHLAGVAAIGFMVYVAARLLGPVPALLAGLMATFTPVWLGLEHTLQPDFLFGAFAITGAGLLALALAEERPARRLLVGAAACVVVAAYIKPVGQALLVAVPLAALLTTWDWRAALRTTATVWLVAALLLAPWLIRNAIGYGEWSLSSQSAQTLTKRVFDIDGRPWPDTAEGRLAAQIDARREQVEPDAEKYHFLARALEQRGMTPDEAVAFSGTVAKQAISEAPLAYVWGTVEATVRYLTDVNSFSYDDLSSGENSSSLRPGTASPVQLGVAVWYWSVRVLAWAWWILALAGAAGLLLLRAPERRVRAAIAAFAAAWLAIALSTALSHGGLRRYSAQMAPAVWVVGSAGAVLVTRTLRRTVVRERGVTVPTAPSAGPS